jgi:predicted transcriptional regulator
MLPYALNEFNTEKNYIDVHSLQFTPQSFEKIINILEKYNFIDFTLDKIYHTKKNQNEFIVVLKKKN